MQSLCEDGDEKRNGFAIRQMLRVVLLPPLSAPASRRGGEELPECGDAGNARVCVTKRSKAAGLARRVLRHGGWTSSTFHVGEPGRGRGSDLFGSELLTCRDMPVDRDPSTCCP